MASSRRCRFPAQRRFWDWRQKRLRWARSARWRDRAWEGRNPPTWRRDNKKKSGHSSPGLMHCLGAFWRSRRQGDRILSCLIGFRSRGDYSNWFSIKLRLMLVVENNHASGDLLPQPHENRPQRRYFRSVQPSRHDRHRRLRNQPTIPQRSDRNG